MLGNSGIPKREEQAIAKREEQSIPREGRTGKARKMKFIAYRHQTRVHENDHLMINRTASLAFHLERKPNLLPWNSLGVCK